MTNARSLVPLMALYLYIYYLYFNIGKIGVTGGLHYLGLTIVTMVLAIFLGRFKIYFQTSIDVLLITLFILYYFFRLVLDGGAEATIKAELFGSTSGLVFYLFSGIFLSIIILTSGMLSRERVRWRGIYFQNLIFILLLFCLYSFMDQVRDVNFLVNDDLGAYQRPGNLITIFCIIISFIYIKWVLLNDLTIRNTLFENLVYFSNCILLFLIAQVIGSNMGAAAVIIISCATFIYQSWVKNVLMGINNFFSWSIKIFFSSLLILLALIIVIYLSEFSVSAITEKFRIFGFGEGEVSSFSSRYDIFAANFMLHWSHSPFWGYTRVELETTGEGTYVHSILSVLTHTGVVGATILFCSLLAWFYRKNKLNLESVLSPLEITAISIYQKLIMLILLACCLIATTFTWPPLWFAIGLFFQPLKLRSVSKS